MGSYTVRTIGLVVSWGPIAGTMKNPRKPGHRTRVRVPKALRLGCPGKSRGRNRAKPRREGYPDPLRAQSLGYRKSVNRRGHGAPPPSCTILAPRIGTSARNPELRSMNQQSASQLRKTGVGSVSARESQDSSLHRQSVATVAVGERPLPHSHPTFLTSLYRKRAVVHLLRC